MNDTIVALASAHGPAPRAILRLSGPKALEFASALTEQDLDAIPGFHWVRALVSFDSPGLPASAPADVFVMRAPRSYTREDVAEIHTVGSMPLIASLLHQAVARGARLAEPGEFTRRAYLAGRVTLGQAEAVAKMIAARSESARRTALTRLEGRLERELETVRDLFVRVLAMVEGHLDFTEADTEYLDPDAVKVELQAIASALAKAEGVLNDRPGEEDAVQVVLLGPPNAGKSTLFSTLIPERPTLVSPVAGTTRDLVEGELSFEHCRAALWDAPGIGEAQDELEALAIDRLMTFVDRADFFLVVLDGAKMPTAADVVSIAKTCARRPHLVVLNKVDLGVEDSVRRLAREIGNGALGTNEPIEISLKRGDGIDALREKLGDEVFARASEREQAPWAIDAALGASLGRARVSVERALHADLETELELAVFEMREAMLGLSAWLAPVDHEEVLDAVFSRFCIGK